MRFYSRSYNNHGDQVGYNSSGETKNYIPEHIYIPYDLSKCFWLFGLSILHSKNIFHFYIGLFKWNY